MKKNIAINMELCVGCNRCARACPIEMANITYQDEDGSIKVRIDENYCISCGSCISVCKHNAREHIDDIDLFFRDIENGEPVTLITAPSLKSNFKEWRQLLTFFRQKGVQRIYDVSLGADICIWAHLRYIEKYNPGPMVTQPCAAIVSYCEIHRPELLEHLSPIQSPMACTAIYINKHEGITGKIAAVSPCIAKANEFEAIGTIHYNITFSNLVEYIAKNEIVLPEDESDFDHYQSGLGSVFPVPGGLKENIEFFSENKLRIERAEGQSIYHLLDEYLHTPEGVLPDILDVLNCADGCNIGPGGAEGVNVFEIQANMDSTRRAATKEGRREYYTDLHARYDEIFELEDFIREYTPSDVKKRSVSESEIQKAFEQLNKSTFVEQNFNCGACGSDSCHEMARKIALGINVPVNCVVKARDDAVQEHEKNVDLVEKHSQYIELIHQISDNLMSIDGENTPSMVSNSMQALCDLLQEDTIYIWKYIDDDHPYMSRIYGWSAGDELLMQNVYYEELEEIFNALASGKSVIKTLSTMSESEKAVFYPVKILSTCAIPIIFRGGLWGFIAVNNDEEREYTDEQVSLVAATALIIAANIIEREMSEVLMVAQEEALAGARAKSDFLSRMSHEIRTPMNTIIGMTKIADNSMDMDRLRYCLSTISTSATHLLGLINDILDMAKIESGKFELNELPFNIEQAVVNVCNFVIDSMIHKKLRFHVFFDLTMQLNFVGDELRLAQVITNLLGNAVKFTPENGSVALMINEIEDCDGAKVLRFEIRDTGIGMTDEQMSRLFSSFEQADGSISRRFGGTGLGLAISKNIIESMGGKIWAESTPGNGSSFYFEIGLKTPSGAETSQEINLPDGFSVLIADEDELSGIYLKSILESHENIRCDYATDRFDAVDMLRDSLESKTPYDLIFIDHDIAGTDWIETAKNIPGLFNPETAVVIAPFLVWNEIESDIKSCGISRNIAKPLFACDVRELLARHIGVAELKAIESTTNEVDFSKVRVLLAEDIDINREIFITLFEYTGMNIDIAENGRIAVDKVKNNPNGYDIIIMDIQMPEMDGYEATRTIRALGVGNSAEIPIIAMSANALVEDVERCLASGMNDHLPKPIDADDVIKKIAHYTVEVRMGG